MTSIHQSVIADPDDSTQDHLMDDCENGLWQPALWLMGLVAVAVFAGCAGTDDPVQSIERDTGHDHADVHRDTGRSFDVGSPGDGGLDVSMPVPDAGVDIGVDSGVDSGADVSEPPPILFPAVYPVNTSLSPLTPWVVENLRQIAARDPGMQDDVFAKIGASNTVNTNFVSCLATPARVNLAGRDHLQPTVAYFGAGQAGGTNPYERVSLAATVGWSAGAALSGSPSPLTQELNAISPRYGLVMFGTNDIQRRNIFEYGANLLTIADELIARGVIPVFTSIPSRNDSADADLEVPRYNAVQRAVAQARQVPYIDVWHEWLDIPNRGLAGDGIHLNTFERGCVLTETGLGYGHNLRNLRTLEMLHGLREVLDGADAPDTSGSPQIGDGSVTDPLLITSLPFVDARNTALAGTSRIDYYTGCDAAQNESGPEFLYRFVTDRAVRVRAIVIDRAPTDIDVHLLDHTATAEGCIARAHQQIVHELAPGTYHFSLDTFVSAGGNVRSGEYLFVLLEE